jgi:hypothetical protein
MIGQDRSGYVRIGQVRSCNFRLHYEVRLGQVSPGYARLCSMSGSVILVNIWSS